MPRTSATERDERSVIAVERACDVLVAVCASATGPMGVKEISVAVGLSGSTVHRLLAAMLKKGLLEQDSSTKKYAMGRKLMDITLDRFRHMELPVIALPHMRRLRDATTETVALSMVDGWTQSFLVQVESRQEIRQAIEIGKRLPLHFGGSGKATLALMSDAELEDYLGQSALGNSAASGVDVKRLRAELAEIRKRGYARSASERVPGAASVAAAVRNHLGEVVGCISVSGPAWRFTDEHAAEYGRMVLKTAADISHDLGAPDCVPHGCSGAGGSGS